MYIDFHIHAFADAIAERAVTNLEGIASIKGNTRGGIEETISRLEEWSVDKAVLLPIATKPKQQETINTWAVDVMNKYDQIISFGTVHPDSPNAVSELERIKSLGLKGLKLHPDYQGFIISDEKMYPIYEKCQELGLPVLFHAGYDPLSPDLIHAVPQESSKILDKFPKLTVILAHMGGMKLWDDVEKYIVGRNVYLDTAYISGSISDKQAERIIKNHGANKILLASDLPWHKTTDEIQFINSLDLTDDEKDMIFFKNAQKLLGI